MKEQGVPVILKYKSLSFGSCIDMASFVILVPLLFSRFFIYNHYNIHHVVLLLMS
ncbi:hypothetical protein BDR04DRAFT_1102814 [Suillus decipiens]|nr:hypothetical protein BDR04DRAFT_1102814 [Suillus decipiens]